jgi:glycosyltransferase involved in cell wall biosynthesis
MARRITPLRDLISIWRLYRVLRRFRPDIVHAQTPKGGLLGTIAAWLAATPVRIYHIRGLPYMGAVGVRRFLLRNTERVACTLSHAVLCVSRSVREVAVAEPLCAPDKITVLLGGSGNGVDALGRFDPVGNAAHRETIRASLGIPPNADVIGFVGRIVRDKGVVELAAAWSALRDAYPDTHLLLVGPFEPQDPIPREVETLLRNDPRVHLTGHTLQTAPFYAAMDLVVLPTYREGFPNVPLEAASMELPVVATRIPGCVDAIQDGVTGTLVPPRDAAALTTAITTYLAHPSLRRAHGQAGRERVLREFRQEAIWAALRAHYEALLVGRGRAATLTTRVPGGDVPRELHDHDPTAQNAVR